MIPDPEREETPQLTVGFALLATVAVAFLQLLILVVLTGPSGEGSAARLGIATIVSYGALFVIAAPRIPAPPADYLGFVRPVERSFSAALLLLPSVLLVSEVDNLFRAVWPNPLGGADEAPSGMALVETAIVLIAVLPVIEEIFFRGMLQPRLVERFGRAGGIAATAGLSGLAWLGLPAGPWIAVALVCNGLVLGLLRESSRSLLPGLLVNVGFGACRVAAVMYAFGIPGFDDMSADHTPLAWLVPAALLVGVGLRQCQAMLASADAPAAPDGS